MQEAGDPVVGVNCFYISKGPAFSPNPSANLAGVESRDFLKKAKTLAGILFLCIAMSTLMITPAFADTYYTVKSGDCLWNIANKTGVTVGQIKTLNGLDSNLIHPGQSLLITLEEREKPAPAASDGDVSRGTNRIEEILSFAKSYIGTPYLYGGESPRGFDCSGFVPYVFKNYGIDLAHNAQEQFNQGAAISADVTRPGDLVFFSNGNAIFHSGIFIGDGKFIHSTPSHGVQIASVYGPFWTGHLYGFSRIIP